MDILNEVFRAAVAQWLEQVASNQKVTGSKDRGRY